jgi:hypothetical protein
MLLLTSLDLAAVQLPHALDSTTISEVDEVPLGRCSGSGHVHLELLLVL